MALSRHPLIQEDVSQIAQADLPWQQLSGLRVLVTGASGFIGGYLMELLSYLNEVDPRMAIDITALVRNGERFRQRFPHLLDRPDVHLNEANLTLPVHLDRPVDVVIHCASEASPKYYLQRPVDTVKVNTLGTLSLLDIAQANNARLLFLSSGAVYGQNERLELAENDYGIVDPLDARACYSEGKRAAEACCIAYYEQYRLDTRIARISHTYGPGLDLDDGRVFTDFMADALAGRDIRVKGAAGDARPFCYIADMVEGLMRILLMGSAGQAYNLGADSQIRISELAQILCEISEHPIRVTMPEQQQADALLRNSGYFNIDKIRALGWQCRTSVRAGFERMYQYYLT
jgi:nucleoside-diphosphate-sugar epimerase